VSLMCGPCGAAAPPRTDLTTPASAAPSIYGAAGPTPAVCKQAYTQRDCVMLALVSGLLDARYWGQRCLAPSVHPWDHRTASAIATVHFSSFAALLEFSDACFPAACPGLPLFSDQVVGQSHRRRGAHGDFFAFRPSAQASAFRYPLHTPWTYSLESSCASECTGLQLPC